MQSGSLSIEPMQQSQVIDGKEEDRERERERAGQRRIANLSENDCKLKNLIPIVTVYFPDDELEKKMTRRPE